MEVIKICKKHGELKKEDIKIWLYKNKIYKRCKMCIRDKNQRYQEKNKNDREWLKSKSEKNKIYWKKNKENIIKKRKNPERIAKYEARKEFYNNNNRDKYREKQKIYRDKLHPSYVKRIFCERSILSHNEIPDGLIKIKREILFLKRKIKEIKSENK